MNAAMTGEMSRNEYYERRELDFGVLCTGERRWVLVSSSNNAIEC